MSHQHPIRLVSGRNMEQQNNKNKGCRTLPDQERVDYLRDGRSPVGKPSVHTGGALSLIQTSQQRSNPPMEWGKRCLNQRGPVLSLHDSRGPQASFATVHNLPGRHVPPPARSYSEEDYNILLRYGGASSPAGREVYEKSDVGGNSTQITNPDQAKQKTGAQIHFHNVQCS